MSRDGYHSVLYGQGLFVRLYPLLPNVVIIIRRVARENHGLDLLGHILPYSLEIQRDGLFLFRVFVGNGIDKSFSLFVGCENDVQNAYFFFPSVIFSTLSSVGTTYGNR